MQDLPSGKEIGEILEEERKIKKVGVKIISIFLLGLILSYLLLGYPIYPIIASNYDSHSIEGNTIFTEDANIVFLVDTYDILKEHYLKNEEVEISACLNGYVENNYFIEEVFFPEVITKSVNSITFKSCPEETIIWLHSHPYKKCIASKQDLNTLDKQKNNNKKIAMVIMCSETQFNIYE